VRSVPTQKGKGKETHVSDDNPVMPIGKHKGRPVAEVMATDPNYVQWLQLQPWFVEKYKPTYNFIVQAGPPSEMSPEHNALQAKFLDDAFCQQVVGAVISLPKAKQSMIKWTLDWYLKRVDEHKRKLKACMSQWRFDQDKLPVMQRQYDEAGKIDRKLRSVVKQFATVPLDVDIENRTMEEVCDVMFDAVLGLSEVRGPISMPSGMEWDEWKDEDIKIIVWRIKFLVECKPSLGDDYPAVLRQMKDQQRRISNTRELHLRKIRDSNYEHVLIYSEFAATGATIEQVKKIFSEANIYMISVTEIGERNPSAADPAE
jgi:Exodeoxyribonuclease X-like C-terminal